MATATLTSKGQVTIPSQVRVALGVKTGGGELVWVMQACYHASKEAIAHMLETLLRAETVVVERAELIWQALRRFQAAAQADFADCLIERCAPAAACKYKATFDRNAAKAACMKNIG